MNVSRFSPYAKALVALAGFVLVVARAALDGTISADELNGIAITALTVIGVHQVPNKV